MNRRYALSVLVGMVVVVVGLSMLTDTNDEISPDELRRRVEATTTDWANYHEDLKGQIGSTPVARWKGEPVSSRIEGNTLSIVFEVSGYWAEAEVNLPLIILDPLGKTYANSDSIRVGSMVTYTFLISGDESPRVPWIELKYPHATRRIVYAEEMWEAD
ncbi:MAG: hypothetical protein VCB26_04485 [Candidatus Hydrogenedentota bacterium]